MNKYGDASFETILKRKMLCLQFIENKITLLSMKFLRDGKWACATERSAVVPRNWDDRRYWLQVMELIMKLKSQNKVINDLIDESIGWKSVPQEQMAKNQTIEY
ncbi:hypothetical protein INT47_002396 [Mucor saturninus]|uniref:Uncharacterized protein n=1 Tax=Mucor saturninus TaxID=64648 RepID=A0A8H7RGA5_9FUNG|nr:hypothetical protein INT47_002396 [Mucor saturninus]